MRYFVICRPFILKLSFSNDLILCIHRTENKNDFFFRLATLIKNEISYLELLQLYFLVTKIERKIKICVKLLDNNGFNKSIQVYENPLPAQVQFCFLGGEGRSYIAILDEQETMVGKLSVGF